MLAHGVIEHSKSDLGVSTSPGEKEGFLITSVCGLSQAE